MNIQYRTTTKNKKDKETLAAFCMNYMYYHKADNSDSTRWVCRDCYASITVASNRQDIIKINGKVVTPTPELLKQSHKDNHS